MKRSRIESTYCEALSSVSRSKEIYGLYALDGESCNKIAQKTGLSYSTVYRIIHTFELENPELAEQMKKKGRDVVPEDYQKLLSEINRLKSELEMEKLRADFYQEMVAFGEEVYGIDLKKAGTK